MNCAITHKCYYSITINTTNSVHTLSVITQQSKSLVQGSTNSVFTRHSFKSFCEWYFFLLKLNIICYVHTFQPNTSCSETKTSANSAWNTTFNNLRACKAIHSPIDTITGKCYFPFRSSAVIHTTCSTI